MLLEKIDNQAVSLLNMDRSRVLKSLHMGFESRVSSENNAFQKLHPGVENNIARWTGLDPADMKNLKNINLTNEIKRMYYGSDLNNGKHSDGLKSISARKLHENYMNQNIKQQSGFSAEILSTTKENIIALARKTGIVTYRADDLPKSFDRNNQYVDKVRVNNQNQIVERIQTKFVGNDGTTCLSKLASSSYAKYFDNGFVDKIEIPKNYYDQIMENKDGMNMIQKRIIRLEKQLERVKLNGKTEAVAGLESRIDRYHKIENMVESSTVTTHEAEYARLHPKRTVTKLMTSTVIDSGHELGKQNGISAAAITAATSTIDNMQKVMNGEITAKEGFADVTKDTGTAAAIGYGSAFISSAVSQTMSYSSHNLIQSLGKSGIPAAAISVGISSFDSITDYAQGVITGKELAYDLGDSVSNVAGGVLGSAVAGAMVGSVVPVTGTVAGFAVGMVGGMAGCAVASQAYKTAIEYGSKDAKILAEKAQGFIDGTIDLANKHTPEKLNDVKLALHEFVKENKLPLSV